MLEARLVMVDYDQIDSILIEKDSQKISLKRSIDGWSLEEPLKDFADNSVVDDFLKGIATERIFDIAKDGAPIEWSVFGLDKPLGKVTFATSAGLKQTFSVSDKKNFEQNGFARRDNEERVLVVSPKWQERVNKTALEFRERHVLRHKISSIDSFNLKNEKGLLELTLKEGKWICPSRPDLKLDQNKVRELLQTLVDAKASEYIDGQGPTLKPLFTLDLIIADKKWNAQIGQAQDFKIYAKVSEPNFMLKLEPTAVDKLIQITLDDLKETIISSGKDKK